MNRAWLLGLLLAALAVHAGEEAPRVPVGGRQALATPMPGLDDAERTRFTEGRGLFRQVWVIAPSRDDTLDGLGPLYNRPACTSCHPANGRGQPPGIPGERMREMLVRLSVPGSGPHGRPQPHPVYGDQLNETGIPGVPGEGRAALHWEIVERIALTGGETVELRRPRLKVDELAYGPLDGALSSARVGPAMIGLGWLDAVDEATLEALAAAGKGRVNRVWDAAQGRPALGRFGFKANTASLADQIASAMAGDLGITSTAYPQENCTAAQLTCQAFPSGGTPELSDPQLHAIRFYLAHLALPARQGADTAEARLGQRLFGELGCDTCHRPRLRTSATAVDQHLRNRWIEPYTDLLLHDLGEGLSDGRPDYLAGPRDWRTAPLWGLGSVERLGSTTYLHDGRARNLAEAILWHGGEAQGTRDRFAALPAGQRQALYAFLRSL